MPESPDDILRALADPERLAIAGLLARGARTADDLAADLELAPKRVRTHLGKLTAAGIVRVGDDRRTYRLDPETLAARRRAGRAATRGGPRARRRHRRRGACAPHVLPQRPPHRGPR